MTDRYAREDHPFTEREEGREHWRKGENIMAGEDQNGNVSRLLNDVQKQLAVMHEELGGLADRLKSVSRSLPVDADMEGMVDGPKPPMSPLAETVQIVLRQLRDATSRISEIKAGVDL